MLSLESISEFLSYDPETGLFVWIKRPPRANRVRVGDVAGTLTSKGYRNIRFDHKAYRGASLAWLFAHGELPPDGLVTDHINGAPGDDRIANIRLGTQQQNSFNTQRHANSANRFKGIWFDKHLQSWRAGIKKDGKHNHLGVFKTDREAARAYDAAAQVSFGVFARLNFPANHGGTLGLHE